MIGNKGHNVVCIVESSMVVVVVVVGIVSGIANYEDSGYCWCYSRVVIVIRLC